MLPFALQFLGQVRLARLNEARPKVLGQNSPFTSPREIAFRIIDENGFHVVNPGKKFPFTVSNMVWGDGTPLQSAPVNGTALSEAESASSSVVRIKLPVPQDPNNFALQDAPVDATLSLYGVYGNVTYPIFENRRIRFVVPWASPEPLDLKAIYAQVLADKVAADTAAQEQISTQNYQDGLATEAQAAAAAEKARLAAEDAATKKKAADAARATAAGEMSTKKTLLYAVGGVAALGVISYFAFFSSGK